MRGDVESAIRNIDDFWTGDDETKRFVMEKTPSSRGDQIADLSRNGGQGRKGDISKRHDAVNHSCGDFFHQSYAI